MKETISIRLDPEVVKNIHEVGSNKYINRKFNNFIETAVKKELELSLNEIEMYQKEECTNKEKKQCNVNNRKINKKEFIK